LFTFKNGFERECNLMNFKRFEGKTSYLFKEFKVENEYIYK